LRAVRLLYIYPFIRRRRRRTRRPLLTDRRRERA
jgi:hypothetical protein